LIPWSPADAQKVNNCKADGVLAEHGPPQPGFELDGLEPEEVAPGVRPRRPRSELERIISPFWNGAAAGASAKIHKSTPFSPFPSPSPPVSPNLPGSTVRSHLTYQYVSPVGPLDALSFFV
jgi:hypothetical protein